MRAGRRSLFPPNRAVERSRQNVPPTGVPTGLEHIHRAGCSPSTRKNAFFSFLEKQDYLLARDAGKILKKFVNRITAFEVIDEILNRHARAGKARRTTHNLRIDFDNRLAHGLKLPIKAVLLQELRDSS